ncbi:MAG TPA: NPCBM/NEW2 domain-containing protein [Pirellulales bacterium]|nr:NPCBM/NEW2 domain-containing protein [Pirellulales bacterium]
MLRSSTITILHRGGRIGLLFIVAQVAVAYAATVIPATGARFEGQLQSVTADGQATFLVDGARRSISLGDVSRYGALVEPGQGIEILLTGGGLIVADAVHSADEELHIESALFGERTIPLEFVAGVVFDPPRDLPERDRLIERAMDHAARSDRLLLANGDELTGTVASVSGTAVGIESQGQKLSVDLPRIAAVAFDPSLAAAPRASAERILVGLRDGSRFAVSGIVLGDKEAQVKMPDGATWTFPAEALACLQPLSGKAKYLSDLTAEGYRHLPFLNQSWPYRNDASATGTQLRAAGHTYAKGIGMHSAARLTYRLDKRYRRFAAEVALDDQVGDRGAATFGVYVDDKLAWKSDMIHGRMAPVPVDVDVSGGKRLSLIVEFGDRGDELDRANWLDARLIE